MIELKTQDRRRAVEIIIDGLRKQGGYGFGYERPDSARPICLYRTPDGKKCAAGLLLTEESFNDPGVEENEEWSLLHWGREIDDEADEGSIGELISMAQVIHDKHAIENDNIECCIKAIIAMAEELGVNVTGLV